MNILPKSVIRLIEEFNSLPSIGQKTASRLALYILNQSIQDVRQFSGALLSAKDKIRTCSKCFGLSEDELCFVCQDIEREKNIVMVVEGALDIVALEKTGYKGVYHVLGGALSPIDGVGPDDLTIAKLLERLKTNTDNISEVIIATNPSLEGEATALYIIKLVEQSRAKKEISGKIAITRIARGIPVGGDIEYADEITLSNALEGRRTI